VEQPDRPLHRAKHPKVAREEQVHLLEPGLQHRAIELGVVRHDPGDAVRFSKNRIHADGRVVAQKRIEPHGHFPHRPGVPIPNLEVVSPMSNRSLHAKFGLEEAEFA